MKIALIGFEQAGKRTLFSLLTGRVVGENRKPGDVIEGVADIRDPRVDKLAELCQPEKTVYAQNHFVLCPDAVTGSESRQWLDAARRCDLLCLVVRAFESDQVYHPDGSIDADRDETALKSEILLADMALVEKRQVRLVKDKRSGLTSDQKVEEKALEKCMATLEEERWVSEAGLTDQELASIRSLDLLTLLPAMVVRNVSEADVGGAATDGAVTVSCQIEQEISAIEDVTERNEYLESLGLNALGVDRVNAAAYDALGLMSLYTSGKDECRAWTIRKGSLAPTAGGKIHSDIERGFIRVEVTKFNDFLATGSEKAAKDQGKVLLKGKDYIIEDGDICHFLFNV
ncbi:MAG: redox-regulated ATPase YchF [Lentisphaerae bacterium]|nr:redox-regulated ATPase YchF [Lentisphaerota bacterium]